MNMTDSQKNHFYSWEVSIAYVDLGKRISEHVEDSGKPFGHSVTCSLEILESLFSLRFERCWWSCCIWLQGMWGTAFWAGGCNPKDRRKHDWWAKQTLPGAALGYVEELLGTCDGQENHFEANGHMQTDDKTTGQFGLFGDYPSWRARVLSLLGRNRTKLGIKPKTSLTEKERGQLLGFLSAWKGHF